MLHAAKVKFSFKIILGLSKTDNILSTTLDLMHYYWGFFLDTYTGLKEHFFSKLSLMLAKENFVFKNKSIESSQDQ